MRVWLPPAVYLLIGFSYTAFRCWRIGVHRVSHAGHREFRCGHWACEVLVDDGVMLTLTLLFWPLVSPIWFIGWFFRMLIQAPYLRSLPPKGSETARKQ